MTHRSEERADLNEVHLIGRISATPVVHGLAGGGTVLQFRLVIQRESGGSDAVDCRVPTTSPCYIRARREWNAGARVEVSGSIHRRFFRAVLGPQSRIEVEITSGWLVSLVH